MNFLLTIFFFVVIVGFLVFVHELGHFLAAKISGIYVREFAIGFGPTLIKRKYKETNYKVNLLPLGGYVQLEGEDDMSIPNGFRGKPFHIKLFVLTAGVLMNFLVAVLLFAVTLKTEDYKVPLPNITSYNFHNVQSRSSYFPITIGNVQKDWGWKNVAADDSIVAINNTKITSSESFEQLVSDNKQKEVDVTFLDLNTFQTYTKKITVGGLYKNKFYPIEVTGFTADSKVKDQLAKGDTLISIAGTNFKVKDDLFNLLDKNQGKKVKFGLLDPKTLKLSEKTVDVPYRDESGAILGVTFNINEGLDLSFDSNGWESYFLIYKKNISAPISFTYDMGIYQLKGLANLVSTAFKTGDYSKVSQAVGGPVALGESVNQVVTFQIYKAFFFLIGLISLSLAIFNIFPLPAFDGGQVAIALVEAIRRKKLPDSLVAKINLVGFVFIIAWSLLITFKDLSQIRFLASIENFVKGVFGR